MDIPGRGRPPYALTRTLSSTSPALEASHQSHNLHPTLERRRVVAEASSNAARGVEDHEISHQTAQRPSIRTANSYGESYQNDSARQPSPTGSSNLIHSSKKSGGGSFAQSRGYNGAPPLHITVNNTGGPSRLNSARLGPSTPLYTGIGHAGTPGIFPPTSLTTGSVARRAFRSRTSMLFGIALFTMVFAMYFTTFHPEASDALIKSATAPLERTANAAKAAIKGGGATGADMEGESWRDLLGFGSDLLDINSWGLLNSGRDKNGNLPLSPWNRYKENWNRHREDALLQNADENEHDGRVIIEEGKPHPIPILIARAKKRWQDLQNRQSKTFAQAVAEYERRYGRRPPRGFDRWYAFAKANNVRMIDEFDLIEHSLRPFRAFEPASFRRRASKAASMVDTWRIRITRGQVYREGQLGHHERAQGIIQMCKKFKHELPDMIIGYNGHDGSRINIGWEERMRLEDLIEDGVEDPYLPKDSEMAPIMESPPPGWGIPQTCPIGSAMRQKDFVFQDPDMSATGFEIPSPPPGAVGSLIGGFKQYMDVCESPQYRHYHASTSWSYRELEIYSERCSSPWLMPNPVETWPTTVMPLFTPGVHARFGDVYCIIDEQFTNEAAEGLPWYQRTKEQAVWRGQASGPFYESNTPWQSTQRPRLHLQTHSKNGSRSIVVSDKDGIARRKAVKNSIVNPLFFDTGIVGPALQCLEEDGTCDKMGEVFEGFDDRLSFEDQEEYKYQLDVDGNSWSGRFRRLMLSNGAVLKATIFQEFWTDWAVPWVHFIPLQVDYSDIYDVMAFFRGGPGGDNAHDDLAYEIAMAGQAWAKKYMRWEDIEAYTFRQYLEYGRLYNADREDMDFVLEVPDYEPVWYHVH